MATTTTRLALTKPAGTDVVDIDVLNANADKIDTAVGAYICTSTTRPSTPYAGQVIYETDSKLTWTYASGAWKLDTGVQPVVASSAARDAIFPSPVQGDSVWRSDLGFAQTYYAVYNSSTNTSGRTPAGWYSGQDGGLVPITPSSIAVGSGTASVASNGVVTFSGVSSISLREVFLPTYNAFRVVSTFTGSAAIDAYYKFLNGITSISAGYNGAGMMYGNGQAPVTIWVQSAATSALFSKAGVLGTNSFNDVYPKAGYSSVLGSCQNPDNSFSYSVCYNTTTATRPDGLNLLPGSGTMSGTVQVYGYRN